MTDLWVRMTALYLHRWTSAMGESFGESGPFGTTWQAGLAGISNTQVAHGLHACITRDDGAWPPTLPEFRALCMSKQAVTFAAQTVSEYVPQKADRARMPSPERLQWHKDNIAWIEKGGELPRPHSFEPPAPDGCESFWKIYRGPDNRSAAERAMTREDWL